MIRKLATVALATIIMLTAPVLLTAATDPSPTGVQTAMQPAPDPEYPDWLFEGGPGEPNWGVLENCWIDRHLPHAQRQVIFQQQIVDMSGREARRSQCPASEMTIWCDWRVGYPSRHWVEQGCGRIAGWGAGFGASWSAGWGEHPARDWVARLRAGGQP